MTAHMTTATMEQAWEAAVAQADVITPDNTWERSQVKGFEHKAFNTFLHD